MLDQQKWVPVWQPLELEWQQEVQVWGHPPVVVDQLWVHGGQPLVPDRQQEVLVGQPLELDWQQEVQ